MFDFYKLAKADALRETPITGPRDNFEAVELQKADHHPDGKFKLGPSNSQHANGDTAFDLARSHLDEAQKAAKIGDAEAVKFHLQMVQQYANAAAQNHMMGSYIKQTAGQPQMMPAPDMGAAGGNTKTQKRGR